MLWNETEHVAYPKTWAENLYKNKQKTLPTVIYISPVYASYKYTWNSL